MKSLLLTLCLALAACDSPPERFWGPTRHNPALLMPAADGGVSRIEQAWTATPGTLLSNDFIIQFHNPGDFILSQYVHNTTDDTFAPAAPPANQYVSCPSLQVTWRTAVSGDPATLMYDAAVGAAVTIAPMSILPHTLGILQCSYHVPFRAVQAGPVYIWFVLHCQPGNVMITQPTPYWTMINVNPGTNVSVTRTLAGFFQAKSWWRSHFYRCGNGVSDVWWDDGSTVAATHCSACPLCIPPEPRTCNISFGPSPWGD